MGKEYILAGSVYQTKEELIARLRSILHQSRLGEPLRGQERDEVREVLSWHPNVDEKVGPGIASISVGEGSFNTRTFMLQRIDGSIIDFSFLKAIRQYRTSRILQSDAVQWFKQAARMAVLEDIRAFRRLHPDPVRCAVTHVSLTLAETHVDHAPPLTFDLLLFGFCVANRVNLATVSTIDHGMTRTFADPVFAEQWRSYHREHAELRLVHRDVNARLPKSPRIDWMKLDRPAGGRG